MAEMRDGVYIVAQYGCGCAASQVRIPISCMANNVNFTESIYDTVVTHHKIKKYLGQTEKTL